MKTFIFILLIFAIIAFVVCLILASICSVKEPWAEKAYCFLFEHKLWNGWKNVIKNFDKIVFVGYFSREDYPGLENYSFEMPYGETKLTIRYWVKTNEVSVHDYPYTSGGCLTSFDKYHSQMFRDMLIEKFNLKSE